MPTQEQSSHDLLLIITTALFVLFVTGLGVPTPTEESPIILP